MKKKIIDALHFLKDNWKAVLKFHTLLLMMTLGFYLTYALIWLGIGLPQTDLAMGILAGAAVLTEWAYIWWVIHT